MASLIPGFEYDIFISYRQKDNKHDGWVTEFVDNLKGELESTFKEEISVYFDVNSHDGLLETYDVEASLKNKLKCLVFIPVISRTYCDPKSFAWEHEFKAFVEQASKDQFGLKVKLTNGNVACRVLPVRIHDLDPADTMLYEDMVCGVLRGIEFVYEEPGVNRPLTPGDNENKNLKKTRYRNQINKVALAVSEIFQGLETEPEWERFETRIAEEEFRHSKELIEIETSIKGRTIQKNKSKVIGGLVIGLALIFLGYFLIQTFSKPKEQLEKSIAVLPFRNDSPNDSTTYFLNGVMEEILNNLQKISDFSRVLSRNSVEKFRNNITESTPEIAKKLGVNYIVEGSGQKYGNKFVLRVQLIVGNNEKHIWGKSYDRKILETSDLINIQSDIAQSIAAELKSIITPEEKQLLNKVPSTSLTAYDFYQRGKEEYAKYWYHNNNKAALQNTENLYHKALKYDSTFALAYAGLANVYKYKHLGQGYFSENYLDSVLILADIALSNDNQTVEAYIEKGDYYYRTKDDGKAEEEYDIALKINPNSWEAYYGKGNIYWLDDPIKCIENMNKAASLNQGIELPNLLRMLGYPYFYAGFIEKFKHYELEALKLDGDSAEYYSDLSEIESYQTNYAKANDFLWKAYSIDSNRSGLYLSIGLNYMHLHQDYKSFKYVKKWVEKSKSKETLDLWNMHRIGYEFFKNGYKKEAEYYFDKQIEYCNNEIKLKRWRSRTLFTYYDLAATYAFKGEKSKAYENLRIYNQRQSEAYWMVLMIKNELLFDKIRNEPEFQNIVNDIEEKYQAEHERVKKWLEENKML